MTSQFTPEELAALRAPFPLDWHIIREGYTAGGKMRWFVYIDRSAVQDLLDEVFPGEWETSKPDLYFTQSQYTDRDGVTHVVPIVSATVGITIRGITRWDGGDSEGDESTKGALTNAFRRAAAYGWGIGRYLYDGVMIETASWNKGDWKARNAARDDAWKQFTTWYNQRYGMPQKQAPQPAASAKPAGKAQSQPTLQNDAVLGDINAFFEIGAAHFKQVNWKERNNTIKKIFDEGGFAGKSEGECIETMAARFAEHQQKRLAAVMENEGRSDMKPDAEKIFDGDF